MSPMIKSPIVIPGTRFIMTSFLTTELGNVPENFGTSNYSFRVRSTKLGCLAKRPVFEPYNRQLMFRWPTTLSFVRQTLSERHNCSFHNGDNSDMNQET